MQHGKRADAIVDVCCISRRTIENTSKSMLMPLVEESLDLAYHGARAESSLLWPLSSPSTPTAGRGSICSHGDHPVLLDLISNGFYAATKRKPKRNRGQLWSPASVRPETSATMSKSRIRDNGTGIPREVKGKLLQSHSLRRSLR